MVFDKEKIKKVNKFITSSDEIVIVAHKSPDGDSIGSSLGLFHYLKGRNKIVTVCHPDPSPHFLNWLDGADKILNFQEQKDVVKEKIKNADLIFCLDFNVLHRVGKDVEAELKESSANLVMIDHHLYPSDEFDLAFSDTSACSTAQLIFDFITHLGHQSEISIAAGEAIYCGIMTDSGSFRFPSTSAHTHEVIASLLRIGVNHSKVHEAVYDTNTIDRLRLRGFAINEKLEILEEYRTAIITLKENELAQFNYTKGDAEGLVNVGLSIVGIDKSIFLKENDGIIKISFRSKGDQNPVNELANKYFNGGGHANAAGGIWEGSMDEAVKKIKDVLPEFTHE